MNRLRYLRSTSSTAKTPVRKAGHIVTLSVMLIMILMFTAVMTGCGKKSSKKTAAESEKTNVSSGENTDQQATDDQNADDQNIASQDKQDSIDSSDVDTGEPDDQTGDGKIDGDTDGDTDQQTGGGSDSTDKPDSDGKTDHQPQTQVPEKPSGTPVERYGRLSVSGTTLVDSKGKVVQLKGVSTAGMAWFPQYVNEDGFRTMRDEWGIEVIRLAMYTAEYDGYCVSGDGQKQKMRDLVDKGVAAATNLGLYVIIDWHILADNNPNTYKSESIAFFDEMAGKYAGYDNVLFEICNEPNGGTTWKDIKSYAEDVIPVIKKYNSDAIVIVGTPTWSQDVDKAAENPITGYTNIMYTLHFYAATHKDDLRRKLANAVADGLPIFVTEYGICDASGNGSNDEVSAAIWMQLLDELNISSCMWSLSNKNETCAFFIPNNKKTSGWTAVDLTASGKWFVNMMQGSLDLVGTTGVTGEEVLEQAQSGNGGGQAPALDSYQQVCGNITVSVETASTWNSDMGCTYQYNVSLTNTSGIDRKNWTLKISFSEVIEMDQCWCCDAVARGKMLVISPKDWNSTIEASKSRGDIGFIIASQKEMNIVSVTLE